MVSIAYRNDAGLAAAELALAAEAAALGTGAPDTVATAGRVDLAPNTVNSVPREVLCSACLSGAAEALPGVWLWALVPVTMRW